MFVVIVIYHILKNNSEHLSTTLIFTEKKNPETLFLFQRKPSKLVKKNQNGKFPDVSQSGWPNQNPEKTCDYLFHVAMR